MRPEQKDFKFNAKHDVSWYDESVHNTDDG